ncbi:MAG TPA: hypothetical protein P5523_09205 [Bacteroidales bacterium]|nr:hypothetical protein [Bacteroidales bacterium]
MSKLREFWYKVKLILRMFSFKNRNWDKSDFLYDFILYYNYLLCKFDGLQPPGNYIDIFEKNKGISASDYIAHVSKWLEQDQKHFDFEIRNHVFASLEALEQFLANESDNVLKGFSKKMLGQLLDYSSKKDKLIAQLFNNLLKYKKDN